MKQDRKPSLDARKLRAEGKGERERALKYARALRANTPGEQTDPAIVVWAEHGDLAPLLWLLRSDKEISPKIRALIADLLERKMKRPKSRPQTENTLWEERRRANLVMLLERDGWSKRTAAVAQAAEALGCSEKAVQESLRKHEEDLLQLWREEGVDDSLELWREEIQKNSRRTRELVKEFVHSQRKEVRT